MNRELLSVPDFGTATRRAAGGTAMCHHHVSRIGLRPAGLRGVQGNEGCRQEAD